ncbi:DNA polymerase I A, chloroplastic/mitochondrial isoform X3 [Musa acuminata AAA Group]|uniref:DNA polymerase I A, chloroplastic/mitochondrial isoform X3 n=1 Tax=Musa acuminata AAA Group TaxID=214697 RepID=UPI0031DB4889
MAMGVSARGSVLRHPFPSFTYPWFSSCLRRVVCGIPSSSRVSQVPDVREVEVSKHRWVQATVRVRCDRILHSAWLGGKTNLSDSDSHPKIGSSVEPISQESPHPSRYVSPPRQEGRTESHSAKPDKSLTHVQEPCDPVLAERNAVPGEAAVSNGMPINGQDTGTPSDMIPPVEGLHKVVDQKQLARVYDKVIVVDNVSTARRVAQLLTTKYKNFIHACDTEVAKIDVMSETPVGHGELICFSIYSGPLADFGNGKSCIWVDVLDGGRNVLDEFVPFFEDSSIKKVWHNYSFDSHVLGNYGIKLSGFHADTMHLARLFDSSRRANGGYSLEALTNDPKIMSSDDELKMGKIAMKSIFGKRKLKKDGSEGKLITLAPVDLLQREERISWICYSALDSISTFKLFDNLKAKLELEPWTLFDIVRGTMYDFYEEYWRPFGVLLVQMESEGMLVDRSHLLEIEKLAITEKQIASDKFRKWVSKYCPDAKYMNVGSDAQIRQLFFGDTLRRNNTNKYENYQNKCLSKPKSFKVLNTENVIEDGRKSPSKYRTIVLNKICEELQTDMYTDSGLPSVSGDALKVFAGKVSNNQNFLIDDASYQSASDEEVNDDHDSTKEMTEMSHVLTLDEDTSDYGTAYKALAEGKEGRAACQAIAALSDVCSIDSLISNFILPLQGNDISCVHGRVHCSLNINTETGRLSARRPNLQNQPALEKDRYKIRQAFVAGPGKSLIVADYGQLELRILAHLANCKSMLEVFRAGGDFHSRTAMNMFAHVREAVEKNRVLLEWHPQPGEDKPPVPLLKDDFGSERRKAKMLNFSIAYGKTPVGLSRDWKGSAADVAMCAMLEIDRNIRLKELGWRLLLQVHDEVILEGPTESAELAKAIVVECMSKPFYGTNFLEVDLVVDAKCAQSWHAAKC